MLTTFVIGLREGLEAAVIVGIVGAFLIRNGDPKALKAMWVGVGLAIGLSVVAAVSLELAGQRISLRSREMMEGTLALVAVAGVTYMLVWMRRHGQYLKSDLETKAAEALGHGSTRALIGLAFVAVIREGLETAIFLVALLGGSASPGLGLAGAFGGLVVASALGYSFFKGGARIDLGRFFRITGVFLVVVAAGLVSSSVHEFAEAGLFRWWQSPAVDLSAVVAPGTIRGALLTAFVGFQPVPTYAELAAWLAFLIPVGWYVLRPRSTLGSRVAA